MVLAMFNINGYAAGNNVPLTWCAVSNRARRVVGVALGGSTAIGDCKVAIYYGDHLVAKFDNTTAVDVPDKDGVRYISTNFVLGAKATLRVEVITASASAAYIVLVIKNLARRGRY